MYNFLWDYETNGIILTSSSNGSINNNIRPVYCDELDLLDFDVKWDYPKAKEPLLWNLGRNYYYKGELVATTQGGGFFEKPHITFHKEKLELVPVNIERMKEKNSHLIEALSQHAEKFILKKWTEYKRKVDISVAAISGGKDSVALLNLMRRALSPHQFHVVYSDTTMELSSTYQLINDLQILWPELDYHIVRSEKHATQTWREFGPPSRIHRWCCSVHKTVPNFLLLKQLVNKPKIKAIVFDGVRRDESQRRAQYLSVSKGAKHFNQINISPILEWNSAEVHLYTYFNSLPINKAYRQGLARLGCVVCPFSSPWSNSIIWHAYQKDSLPFVEILKEYTSVMGIKASEVCRYIRESKWATRAGGRNLKYGGEKVEITNGQKELNLIIKSPHEDWREWAKTLGKIIWEDQTLGKGLINLSDGRLISFLEKRENSKCKITFLNFNQDDKIFVKNIRSIANKAAYCLHCKACEIECITGALVVDDGKVSIDEKKCIQCYRCISLNEKGCVAAKSLSTTKGNGLMRVKNSYQTFGLRKDWLSGFMESPDLWWSSEQIGNRQYDAMRIWLNESGILKNKLLTNLGEKLIKFSSDNEMLWSIIWTNLSLNSSIVRWYLENIAWGESNSKKDLVEHLGTDSPERTRSNVITSLISLLRDSPLGSEMGLGSVKKQGSTIIVYKRGWKSSDPVSILYSLFFASEQIGKHEFSLNEFFEKPIIGPYFLFGIERNELMNLLRGISERWPKFISVEFIRDLDSLYLNSNKTSLEVIDLAS